MQNVDYGYIVVSAIQENPNFYGDSYMSLLKDIIHNKLVANDLSS